MPRTAGGDMAPDLSRGQEGQGKGRSRCLSDIAYRSPFIGLMAEPPHFRISLSRRVNCEIIQVKNWDHWVEYLLRLYHGMLATYMSNCRLCRLVFFWGRPRDETKCSRRAKGQHQRPCAH